MASKEDLSTSDSCKYEISIKINGDSSSVSSKTKPSPDKSFVQAL